MEQSQTNGKKQDDWPRILMIGCLVLALIFIVGVGGCTYFVYRMVPKTIGGAMNFTNQVMALETYFEDLRMQGWQVDNSQAQQYTGGVGSQASGQNPSVPEMLFIYKARENSGDEWIYYVWEMDMGPMTNSTNPFTTMSEISMVPRTQEALDVHEELGMELEDNFKLDAWVPPSTSSTGPTGGKSGKSGLGKKDLLEDEEEVIEDESEE